jgi:Fe-S-cluster containining protein
VTEGDIRRINAFSGREDLDEYRTPSDPAYLDQDDDPNWNLYTVKPDGTRHVLKQQPNGDCVMLTETGCVLAVELRPLVCRLHPFQYTEAALEGIDPECPAHTLREGRPILEALGMNEERARKWWSILYRELRGEESEGS